RKEKRKARKKEQGRRNARKKKSRTMEIKPKPRLALKQIQGAASLSSTYNAENFDIASTGYISQREIAHSTTFNLNQLTGPKSRYKLKTSMPIIDSQDRVIGVCAGQPRGDGRWDTVQLDASDRLEEARSSLRFQKKELKHRRGAFPA
ncbi:hypothetical protein GALMADRAFT_24713, partial [Galerina marginata CBS 339.88]